MKKILAVMMILTISLSLAACGGNKKETETESVAVETVDKAEDDAEKPSGINEDGIGEDPSYGEGIGEVIALSEEERAYVNAQTTNSWLEMSQTEKDDLVALIARLLEETNGYIVADFDELVAMLDHQMEQYYRNDVDEPVLNTVIDILGIN